MYNNTLKSKISYENIWVRNFVLSILIFGIMTFASTFNSMESNLVKQSYFESISFYISKYLFIFIHNHYLFRLYLLKRKTNTYIKLLLVYFIVFTISGFLISTCFNYTTYFFTEFLSAFLITIFGLSFYIIHTWILENIYSTKKELTSKTNELKFLNQQISPHFLFNAINNLYGLALSSPQNISDKLIELSEILRYQIESIKKDFVPIDEELNFIKNYIVYTKDKTNNLQILYKIVGEYNNILVPPLIFLPLIENAIKFSIETGSPKIECKWDFRKKSIKFTIENNYLKNSSKLKGTNTGIENLTNRLNLLNIKYDLNIDTSTENLYKTEINLWGLSIHV